jgi:hypothetical protein
VWDLLRSAYGNHERILHRAPPPVNAAHAAAFSDVERSTDGDPMKRFAKALILAAVLVFPLLSAGCVYVPARHRYGAVWVPAHWAGPRSDVWVVGHWR